MFLAHSATGQPIEEVTSLLLIGDTVLALWFIERRGKEEHPMRRPLVWVLGGLAALGLAAALTTSLWLPKSKPKVGPRKTTTARIAIRAPRSGQVVGPDVDVRIELIGGTVVGNQVVNSPDGGHIHISLDGKLLTQSFQLEQTVHVDTAGLHTITADYVQADHQPFLNPVEASVVFTVRA